MFPFTIKYSSIVENPDLNTSEALTRIQRAVEAKNAKIVSAGFNEVVFSGTTARFASNWNFALTVDKALFLVVEENSKIKLIYEIYIHNLIYFSFSAAIFVGLISFSFLDSLFALLWLGGANMTLIYIQHSAFFNNVVDILRRAAANADNGEARKVLTKEDKKEARNAILIVLFVMTLIILLIMLSPL